MLTYASQILCSMLFAGTNHVEQDGKVIKTAWEGSQPLVTAKIWGLRSVTIGTIACAATVVSY